MKKHALHDLHNALFALDDAREKVDDLSEALARTGESLETLQGYLEALL